MQPEEARASSHLAWPEPSTDAGDEVLMFSDEEEEEEDEEYREGREARRRAKVEEKRKRQEWRQAWKQEKRRREEEREKRKHTRSRQEDRLGESQHKSNEEDDLDDPRKRAKMWGALNRDVRTILPKNTIQGGKAPGQISDADLDMKLRSKMAASTPGRLMSEAEVVAKLQKDRRR